MRESCDRVATYEKTDSVKEQVMVAVHDTVMEVTTITIRENEQGDTLRVSTVTDRFRARNRDAIATQRTKQEIVRDTVYVERKDSVEVRNRGLTGGGDQRQNRWAQSLRWVFWIIIALIGLALVIKIKF